MGAPVGNTNSKADNRLWASTIRRAIVQSDGKKLREIADKLIELAASGDLQAMKEIGDRLDGKPITEGKLDVTTRAIESLTEEQSRHMAEELIARSAAGECGKAEPALLHDSVSPGLSSGTDTQADR